MPQDFFHNLLYCFVKNTIYARSILPFQKEQKFDRKCAKNIVVTSNESTDAELFEDSVLALKDDSLFRISETWTNILTSDGRSVRTL